MNCVKLHNLCVNIHIIKRKKKFVLVFCYINLNDNFFF